MQPLLENSQIALGALAKDERIRRLQEALGVTAKLHLVGGCLRNVLLGLPSGDIDLATLLSPQELIERLASAGIRTFPTGLKHQTVTALPMEGQEAVEITTFRGPEMSPSGGLVASSSIEEDLRFRDFTVNAFAYDLSSGWLIDVCGSTEDLRNRLLRTPGIPYERFREDPLRVLRLIRFACSLGFEIDKAAASDAKLFADALTTVSVERVREEISKLLVSSDPKRGFLLLRDYGFLPSILPELVPMVGVEQNEFHRSDVFVHSLEVLERTAPDLVLRLAALLHDVGKPASLTVDPASGERHFYYHETIGSEITRKLLERLRFPGQTIEAVAVLVQTHMRPLDAGPGGVRRLIRDTGELLPRWRALKEADSSCVKIDPLELQTRLAEFDALLEEVKKGPPVSPLKSLAVNGHDLMQAGFREGPQIGVLLRALHEQVLDQPELNTKEELLRRARSFAS